MTSKENPGGQDQGIQETEIESIPQCDTIETKNQVNFDIEVSSSCLHAALYYAKKGLPVFPCNASNKRPMTPNGFKDASTDPAVIKVWWENCPDAAIGIPTGEISGLVVVDIDDYKEDFDQVAWDAICEEIGGLPETLTQKTGGGGRQCVFQHPGGHVKSKNAFITGADFKADGGYVIVAPSGHRSGDQYEWINKVNPAPLPAGLLDAIRGEKEASGSSQAIPQVSPQKQLNGKKLVVGAQFEEAIKKAVIGTSPDANDDVRIDCPNPDCTGSQKETMSVNVTKGLYNCFRCDLKGNYLNVNGAGKKPLAAFLYEQANQATDHPYLDAKQIQPQDSRVDSHENLVVPFTDKAGQIQTVQFIDPAGKKRFLSKAKNNGQGVKGAAYRIDGTTDTAYVCEGAATGHSIHEATGCTVYCVGGKENFRHVLPWVKTKHQTVIVAADNDKSGDGLKAAQKAAQKNNLKVACPATTGQDFNDMAIEDGLNAVKDLLEHPVDPGPDAGTTGSSFKLVKLCDVQMKPADWLAYRLMEKDSLNQLFSDPGGCKTFLAIDLSNCVATGKDFHGRTVQQGPVVFIAGEGHNGIIRRFMAWEIHHQVALDKAPIFLSSMPAGLCDADQVGFVMEAIQAVADDHGQPILIVLDTVARNFGSGDENSTRDMSGFIAGLDKIREKFRSCILLIHHTGHSDKSRARGSMALKGALDTEYRLEKGEEGVIRMINTKMKDHQSPDPMAFRLKTVELPFMDDQGQQVTSAVLESIAYVLPPSKGKKGRGRWQTVAIEILKKMYQAQRDQLSANGSDPDQAQVKLDDWQDACYAEGMNRETWRRLKGDLDSNPEVSQDGIYVLPN